MNTSQEPRALVPVIQADWDATAKAFRTDAVSSDKALARIFAEHRLAFSQVHRDREAVARICFHPAKSSLNGWAEALAMAEQYPKSGTARDVRKAYSDADAILALSPAPDGDYVLRSAVIEECARVAGDAWASDIPAKDWANPNLLSEYIAAEIRKLAARPSTPTPDSTPLHCPTCGKCSPDGLDCLTCARWWAANPPTPTPDDIGALREALAPVRDAFLNLIADASERDEQMDEDGIYYTLKFDHHSFVPLINSLGIEQQYRPILVDGEQFGGCETPMEAVERVIDAEASAVSPGPTDMGEAS